MIVKGIIEQTPNLALGDNKYLVHIPVFDTAGSPDKVVIECTYCHTAGLVQGLQVADVVYVSCENNNWTNPIILGKLYINDEREPIGYGKVNTLTVTQKAELPSDTTIGDCSLKEIIDAIKSSESLSEMLKEHATKDYVAKYVSSVIPNLEYYINEIDNKISEPLHTGEYEDGTYVLKMHVQTAGSLKVKVLSWEKES